jgi:predicted aconitase
MATSGQVALFHIPGVTAECQTVEQILDRSAFHNEFSIGASDIRKVYEKLHTAKTDAVDFVNLGCPHYTLEQIRQVALLISGRKVYEDVKLWVFTSRAIKGIAEKIGYADVIKDAGGMIVCDCCGSSSHLRQTIRRRYHLPVPAVSHMITDSVKQGKYVNDTIGCTTVVAKVEDCIEAAIAGKVAV